MLKKGILLSTLLLTSLYSSECSPYYNPNKFYESPEYLNELISENIKDQGLELFGEVSKYKKLNFEQINNTFINKHKKLKEYLYPTNNGLFEYKIKNKKVEELSISKVEIYKLSDSDIANEINYNFEEFWSDWTENNYEMKLSPDQVLFRYEDKYFSFSVYIYGVKGDGTNLKGTTIKYWFKDYTKEVKEYIECENKNRLIK